MEHRVPKVNRERAPQPMVFFQICHKNRFISHLHFICIYIFLKAEILVNPSGFNSSCLWPSDIPYIPSCMKKPEKLSERRAFWDTGGMSVGMRCGSCDRGVRHRGTSLGLWLSAGVVVTRTVNRTYRLHPSAFSYLRTDPILCTLQLVKREHEEVKPIGCSGG